MTTPKPKINRAAEYWEPYPELPPEPKDMQQTPPTEYLRETLQNILTPGFDFPYHPTTLIGSQIPIYYGPASPGVSGPPPHVIPDCLVVFDVNTAAIWDRVGYDPIQNGKPPDFVMEVASRSTHLNDTRHKPEIYRQIGVPEYWRFDPTGGRHYGQAILGEELVNGQYRQYPLNRYADGAVGATSPILNLNFRWRDERFRIHNPTTGAEYEHPREMLARLQEENRRLRGEG
jgi:Uma2 family endonuclease